MGPKERGLGGVVCNRVVTVWNMKYRLGKEECGQDGCDTEKAARPKDWRFVRVGEELEGITVGEQVNVVVDAWRDLK